MPHPGLCAPILLCLLVLLPTRLRAQDVLQAGFERDVNRYRWTAGTDLEIGQGAWTWNVRDRFRSDAFLLFNDRLSFRDENRLSFEARRASVSSTSLVVRGRSDFFSLSRVYHQDLTAGIRYAPGPAWSIEPFAGFVVDARPGFGSDPATVPVRTDAGPSIGVRMAAPPGTVNGYQLQGTAEALMQRMTPRSANHFRADGQAQRTFERTTVRMRVQATSVKRDAYQSASFLNREDAQGRQTETVEATRSDTVHVMLNVETRISDSMFIEARADASTNSRLVRTLRAPDDALFFDSDFHRRTLDGSLATMYEHGSTQLRLVLSGGAETEERSLDNETDLPSAQASQKLNLLQQADYDRGYVSVQTGILLPVLPRTTFQFDGSANLLQHDTPQSNPDDRDELLYSAMAGLQFHVRDDLQFLAQVYGTYFHTVYLKSERSAENNAQTSLRFRPTVTWKPGRNTSVRFSSEVRATYTVDDFILAGRRPTDQSARELRFNLDADHDFGNGMQLRVTASSSDLRLGRFLDGAFAEIPFDTLRTWSGWARLRTGKRIQAEIGLRFFIRTNYDRSATVRYTLGELETESSITRPARTRIDQVGPTTAIIWPLMRGGFLRIEGWATLQRVSNRLYGSLPEDRSATIHKSARHGRTTIIPNLAVTMQWAF